MASRWGAQERIMKKNFRGAFEPQLNNKVSTRQMKRELKPGNFAKSASGDAAYTLGVVGVCAAAADSFLLILPSSSRLSCGMCVTLLSLTVCVCACVSSALSVSCVLRLAILACNASYRTPNALPRLKKNCPVPLPPLPSPRCVAKKKKKYSMCYVTSSSRRASSSPPASS